MYLGYHWVWKVNTKAVANLPVTVFKIKSLKYVPATVL